MFANINTYLFMIASGALAIIFGMLADFTGAEFESHTIGHHRPKKVLSKIFTILMYPLSFLGLPFVIFYAILDNACESCRSYYRQKDLKFSFELGALLSKPCYQQLAFAAQNGSSQAERALEVFFEYYRDLEAQRAACSNDSEQRRDISHLLYTLNHTHD